MMLKVILLLSLMSVLLADRPQFSGDRGQFQQDGVSFKHNNGQGNEKMEFGVAFIIEKTAEGDRVCGDHAMIRLDEVQGESMMDVRGDSEVSRGRLDEDTLDPRGRLDRRPGGRPPRLRRDAPRRPTRDSEQSIEISGNITAESQASRFSFTGEGNGPTFDAKLTAALITSEGDQNVTIGSESQVVKNGEVKYTLEFGNYTFCGVERVCECGNGTNSTGSQLMVCFKTKGSNSGAPEEGRNSEDGLLKFAVGGASIRFSSRCVHENSSASAIVEIPDENIETMVKTFEDGSEMPVVCVTFEDLSYNDTIVYDPTSEVDEDTEEEENSAASLQSTIFVLVLITLHMF